MNKNIFILRNTFIIAILCGGLFSCQQTDRNPDVSHIDVNVEIIRTENVIFNTPDKVAFENEIQKYDDFYSIYLDKVLSLKSDSDSSFYESFVGYTRDSLFADLRKKADERFGDMDEIQDDLTKMYRYFEYYFPQSVQVPRFYTFIADFAYQMFVFSDKGQDAVGLGLDMFLSPEINYKLVNPDNTYFSDYVTRSWNHDHVVQKVAFLHIMDIMGEPSGHRLLDQMIYNGKMLYIAKKVLPFVHDSIIHEYTLEQLEWCEKNQFEMWQFFIENKLFYETNLKKISSYINPAPASLEMPPASPGRTASFLGLKIVEAYMKRHSETSLSDLLMMNDSQMIVDKSRYKPRLQ